MVESSWVRNSIFSTPFYLGNPLRIHTLVKRLLVRKRQIKKIFCIFVPDGGCIYSCATAKRIYIKTVNEINISMSGYAPAVPAMYSITNPIYENKNIKVIDYSHYGMVAGL